MLNRRLMKGMSTLGIVLLVVLVLFLVGAFPGVGLHSYGYGPMGIVSVILVIVLILVLMGRL